MWKLIAAADRNWAIGNKNQLLVQIPSDMRRFRELTTNQIIVMGRKTVATLPSGMPLPARENVILSRDKGYSVRGAKVFHSVEQLVSYADSTDKEVFVIGGESIYRQLLPYCDEAYITKLDYSYEADAHMPNLDEDEEWECVSESEEQTCFDLEFTFRVYKRRRC